MPDDQSHPVYPPFPNSSDPSFGNDSAAAAAVVVDAGVAAGARQSGCRWDWRTDCD